MMRWSSWVDGCHGEVVTSALSRSVFTGDVWLQTTARGVASAAGVKLSLSSPGQRCCYGNQANAVAMATR